MRKVACLVGYFGGFRSCEMKSLKFENCEVDEVGYWFSFERSKQRSMVEQSSICVPRRQPDWSSCAQDASRRPIDYDPASLLDLYFEQLMIDFGCQKEDLKGPFFKGCHGKEGKRFTNVNVGKNTLGYFGVEIASELLLPCPETFTGHCWRRSAGTNASNAGVNVTTLMSMMGWSCPKTAMEYVKRSRITSLQMSMYLANVQRQNCTIPFPSNASDRRRKTKFPSLRVSAEDASKEVRQVEHVFCEEDDVEDDVELSTQDFSSHVEDFSLVGGKKCLKKDIVSESVEEHSVEAVAAGDVSTAAFNSVVRPENIVRTFAPVTESSREEVASNDIFHSNVDSRLSNILQNLNNHGSVHIHFHFDKK